MVQLDWGTLVNEFSGRTPKQLKDNVIFSFWVSEFAELFVFLVWGRLMENVTLLRIAECIRTGAGPHGIFGKYCGTRTRPRPGLAARGSRRRGSLDPQIRTS